MDLINAFSDLASRGESATFYRMVVMAMDGVILLALISLEVLSSKRRERRVAFLSFHLFSLPLLGLIVYGLLLHHSGPVGPGKDGALMHVAVLIWVILLCLWEWGRQNQKVGGTR